MNKLIGAILIGVGAILLFVGFNATQSLGSDIKRFFTGEFSDRAVWMLVFGTVAAIVGFGVVTKRSSASRS